MKIIENSTAKPLPTYRPVKNKHLGEIGHLVGGSTPFIGPAPEAEAEGLQRAARRVGGAIRQKNESHALSNLKTTPLTHINP
jgi:hypothetical protein